MPVFIKLVTVIFYPVRPKKNIVVSIVIYLYMIPIYDVL